MARDAAGTAPYLALPVGDAGHRRVQRLHLGTSDDRRRPRRRDRDAAHLPVQAGLQLPRVRIWVGDGGHHDPADPGTLHWTDDDRVPGGAWGMTLETPRLRKARLTGRFVVLAAGALLMIGPFLYMVS